MAVTSHESGVMTALVVDDEQLAREELGFLLRSFPAVRVVGEAADGPEAVREIASLGLRVRKEQGIRVRQPLAAAKVAVPEEALRTRLESHARLIAAELNVRKVVFRDDPEAALDFAILPNFRRLGPRFGKKMPRIRAALDGCAGTDIASSPLGARRRPLR